MAKLLTKKYQNNNTKSKAYARWYARFLYTETISTDEFVNHICSHGSPFDRGTIVGVLAAACDCLVELTLDSKRVRLGDLGTFYMSAETVGEENKEDFTADNIRKVHLRFWPNQKHSYALDSTSIRKLASFTDVAQLVEYSGSNSGNTSGDNNDDDPDEDRP